MLDFTFQNPTKIVFGKDKVKEVGALVPANSNVLITYGGGSVKRSGLLDETISILKEAGHKVSTFGGIEPNPRFETLMKGVEQAREEKINFLLAVGGGSVLDGTKFMACAIGTKAYFGKEEELMYFGFAGMPTTKDEHTPLASIITLPATGSEMNKGGMISRGEDKLPCFNDNNYPLFSIIDPQYTYTLPQKQVANGIVDTFIHVIEQYLTYPVNARFQDRTSEGILKTLIEIAPDCINKNDDYESRANLFWCSTMALNGLISAGVPQDWSTHFIGHELTALHGLDHGETLAIIFPGNCRINKDSRKEKLLQYASRVWEIKDGSDDEKIDQAIAKTEEFFRSIGMKIRLSEHGIKESDFDAIIKNLEKHGMTALGEKAQVTLEVSRKILKDVL